MQSGLPVAIPGGAAGEEQRRKRFVTERNGGHHFPFGMALIGYHFAARRRYDLSGVVPRRGHYTALILFAPFKTGIISHPELVRIRERELPQCRDIVCVGGSGDRNSSHILLHTAAELLYYAVDTNTCQAYFRVYWGNLP